MIPVSTSETKPLEFKKDAEGGQKFRMQSNKIGWLHALSDKPGAEFDVKIKDSLGRVKFQGTLRSQTEKAGALINVPTFLGEEVEVSVENVKNADKVTLFVN